MVPAMMPDRGNETACAFTLVRLKPLRIDTYQRCGFSLAVATLARILASIFKVETLHFKNDVYMYENRKWL